MKYIFIILSSVFLFSSCSEKAKTLSKMNYSFKEYIKNNDREKSFVTKIQIADAISYEELIPEEREVENEAYKARIVFLGTTAHEGSSKVYNINDTVTCYFDENLKMLRLVNTGEE